MLHVQPELAVETCISLRGEAGSNIQLGLHKHFILMKSYCRQQPT
jgi:hypothetical protein